MAIVKLHGTEDKIVLNISKKAIKTIAGNNYKWTEQIKNIHALLFDYFHGQESELDLNKGIALVGNYGTGKTTIFEIWHKYLRTYYPFCPNLFIRSSIEDINFELSKDTWLDSKYAYNRKNNANGITYVDPKHLLINEFGAKYDIKVYGSDINELFESFLMKRYDIFQQYKKLTHITTNFGTDELMQNFSEKLIDRFKEMFNIIELKGESFRK